MDQLSCNSHVDDDDDDHGWKKVVSRKRNQKQKAADGGFSGDIRRILTPKMFSADEDDESNGASLARSKRRSNSYSDENAARKEKPIVSLCEAMAKIDHSSLADFLVVSLVSEIQLDPFVFT